MTVHKLLIYEKARMLTKRVYVLFSKAALREEYVISGQIKRASVSVVLNIAEGYGKGIKEFRHYLKTAKGSCHEVMACLELLDDLYVEQVQDAKPLCEEYLYLAKQIATLMRKMNT
jgi:four helix bundle protein